MSAVRLGSFELLAPLGRGGMGEVHRAVHRPSGVPAAVKVIAPGRTGRPGSRDFFAYEVRAVASLDHPAVVEVYDHGTVDEAAGRASGWSLVPGSPWLAMELASGGSLADGTRGAASSWTALRALLLDLLDGLAHAHARGVIHRDIKPANILVCGPEDRRPGLKLSDFGLAHAEQSAQSMETGVVTGTPEYMAPEQFEGSWRDFGPWTDLYALGCIGWELATGERPFGGDQFYAVAFAHVTGKRRDWKPRLAVPDGLVDWLGAMLARRPADRFRRAADAAWALRSLPDVREESEERTLVAPALGDLPTRVLPPLAAVSDEDRPTVDGPLLSASVPAPPPVPGSWRARDPGLRRTPAAGLGLFGLRPVPLVDREDTRDALWRLLGRVAEERRPGLALLSGPAGSGKTRLARWFAERAHELGAATPILVTHDPRGESGRGVGPALLRFFRAWGLEGERLRERFVAILETLGLPPDGLDAEADALVALVSADPGSSRVRFRSAGERNVQAARLLGLLAGRRPLLLWLDDVAWGADSLELARHLLEAPSAGPVVLVATVRSEALVERPHERARLDALLAHPRAEEHRVGPLEDADHRALIRGMLGLHPALAARVETRSGGNPLFAVELVGDWVRRGLLVESAEGLRLREDAPARLPEDLDAVWSARVRRVLADLPATDEPALQLAAVLGREVNRAEWEALCAQVGGAPSVELLDRLLGERLAEESPDRRRFWFVHGMLREALEREADRAGRLRSHHEACAAFLEGRRTPARDERLGRHLAAAGRFAEALEPLRRGAVARSDAGETSAAAALRSEWEGAWDRAALPPTDRRRIDGLRTWCRIERREGRYDEAEAFADQALAAAEAGAPEAVGAVLVLRARTRWSRGDADGAREDASTALLDPTLPPGRAAEARWVLGDTAMWRGGIAEARDLFLRIDADQDPEVEGVRGLALFGLGQIALQSDRHAEARELLRRSLSLMQRRGERSNEASCVNVLGELERYAGRLDRALEHYREALRLYRAVGSGLDVYAELNIAVVHAEQGRHDLARPAFEATLRRFTAQGAGPMQGVVHWCLLQSLAAQEDWEAWDRHERAAAALQEGNRFVELDTANRLLAAGREAAGRGRFDRADRVLALAQGMFEALGRDRDAERAARLRSAR